jgi:transcriptional regulator with XRE-family HTH domain
VPREKQYRHNEIIKKLGQTIRELRIQKGLSQEQFAYLCELELSQINRIELGKINTSVSHLFLLAQKLNVKPADLVSFA